MGDADQNVEHYCARYADFMEEIKKRFQSCERIFDAFHRKTTATGFTETDIDFLYLQLRMILELIMFASAVSHRALRPELRANAERHYHAGKLVEWIEKVNPDFFPSPKFDAGYKDGIRVVEDLPQDPQNPYLAKDEMITVYNRTCGDFVHASRNYRYGNMDERKQHVLFVKDRLERIRRLLNHHWVKLSDNVSVAVVMQAGNDGKVHVSELAVQEGPEG